MLSHKNKNQSFVFEEELDQSQNKKVISRKNPSKHESLYDSLECIKQLKDLKDKSQSSESIPSVIIKVAGEDFLLEGESCGVIINSLKDQTSIYDKKYNTFVLPKWIDKKTFELFLNFELLTNSVNNQKIKVDLPTCKKLVDVAVFIKSSRTITNLINECIMPNLDKLTCLKIIKNYIDLIYESEVGSNFVSLMHKCIEIAASNIFYLINNMSDELFSISKDSLEEIIEKYFESVIFNVNIDHSLIMRLMMKSRKLADIYDLLENERKRSIAIFEKLYEEGLEPTIIWKIESQYPNEGFYKESEEFLFENVSLILINYYDASKDLYSLALKITDLKDRNNNPVESELGQFIVSILSICEIKEINFKSKINFNCIFSNTKTKILVTKIENFSNYFTNFENISFSLVIYFSISYNFSSILTHICKNFYEYYSLNSISRISRNVLNIILKNESLNVRSEDEVIYAVMNWGKYF
jgi:hypothetical protein